MKEVCKLENLCCANCAAKMERKINKLEGVKANIAFMTKRLTIETEREMDEVINEIRGIVKKIEKDCEVIRK